MVIIQESIYIPSAEIANPGNSDMKNANPGLRELL
jgi:hypothetical protein